MLGIGRWHRRIPDITLGQCTPLASHDLEIRILTSRYGLGVVGTGHPRSGGSGAVVYDKPDVHETTPQPRKCGLKWCPTLG